MESIANEQKAALVIDERDNVAVALVDLKAGEECIVRFNDRQEIISVLEEIPFGHKFAIVNIAKDESVLKYGEEIGRMNDTVQKGGWIHNHNMYCERGMK